MIGRPFLSLVVHEFITHSINWPLSINPCQEIIVHDILFRDMDLNVIYRWYLNCCVLALRIMFFIFMVMMMTAATKSSAGLKENLKVTIEIELTDDCFLANF